MTLKPNSIAELQELLPQSQRFDGVSLEAVAELIEHVPEDMTAIAQAGMTLADFQSRLAKAGQWLPVDPPHPQAVTIGELLAGDLNGPRRFGCGTIRDWVIGMSVVLPDGRLIRNGGKVVKNVAGFDLCRLFVGAKNELGIIVEAAFKLLPMPEAEAQTCTESTAIRSHWSSASPGQAPMSRPSRALRMRLASLMMRRSITMLGSAKRLSTLRRSPPEI